MIGLAILNSQKGAVGMVQNVVAGAAQQDFFQATVVPATHDNQIRLPVLR
jgi:hypothetical protein